MTNLGGSASPFAFFLPSSPIRHLNPFTENRIGASWLICRKSDTSLRLAPLPADSRFDLDSQSKFQMIVSAKKRDQTGLFCWNFFESPGSRSGVVCDGRPDRGEFPGIKCGRVNFSRSLPSLPRTPHDRKCSHKSPVIIIILILPTQSNIIPSHMVARWL